MTTLINLSISTLNLQNTTSPSALAWRHLIQSLLASEAQAEAAAQLDERSVCARERDDPDRLLLVVPTKIYTQLDLSPLLTSLPTPPRIYTLAEKAVYAPANYTIQQLIVYAPADFDFAPLKTTLEVLYYGEYSKGRVGGMRVGEVLGAVGGEGEEGEEDTQKRSLKGMFQGREGIYRGMEEYNWVVEGVEVLLGKKEGWGCGVM